MASKKKTPAAKTKAPRVAGKLPIGTVLTREYKGKPYTVEIIDDGYRYEGETFSSLTALAKAITKYPNISGPEFFKPAFEAANAKK